MQQLQPSGCYRDNPYSITTVLHIGILQRNVSAHVVSTQCYVVFAHALCAAAALYTAAQYTHTIHRKVKLVIADTPGSEPASASLSVAQQQQGHAIRTAIF
jgi:hypothetical protein